ncbi:RES domain-containing protein [Pseudoalteromonas sp. M8]|uniref:RES domain-containing protein n=1 Tax=Pseudoalteromonas sp. M8 TaxID=2692624 RepID=UPI001BABAC93|nr:RES domain-containing protein [Pseudoalteromonas sp. M8]QUI68495.1 RES domain-containing protein [Pseudoalteromonas sp. M8]
MVSTIRDIFREILEEEITNSIGSICSQCNTSAYYFNQKNKDLYNEKTCVICSNEHINGILLEDFIFTLSRHIPNHYDFIESDLSDSISLGEIVARFTYNNEKVIDKLEKLLCDESPDFFKLKGRYREFVDDSIIESYKKSAIDEWHNISKEVKHTRRFTNTRAIQFYERLIGDCLLNVKKDEQFNSALTKIDKGTSLFRGRVVKDDDHKETISKNPKRELSAPPESVAASNRMSPSGISFMYTAGDYETAISELRPYVGDTIAIGEFVTTKQLNFFDFTLLETVEIRKLNILEDPRNSKFIRSRYLLNELHKLVSKPVRPSDVTYIDLQIFSETIRNYKDGMFDGIIFGSSQRMGGLIMLFLGIMTKKMMLKIIMFR